MQVRRGGRALFAGRLDLTIRGPERIALTGPNGAGKSTLLRIINGELAAGRRATVSGPTAGSPTCPSGWTCSTPTAPWRRTSPRSRRACPRPGGCTCSPASCSAATASTSRSAALSGGERLRATLACVLYAEPAPQLLLLDEPTNNLDLVSVGQLESALNAYEGAFVVVSHDERFLAGIGVASLAAAVGPDVVSADR